MDQQAQDVLCFLIRQYARDLAFKKFFAGQFNVIGVYMHTFDPDGFARDLARHRAAYDRLFAMCELRDLEAFVRDACAHIPRRVTPTTRTPPVPERHTTSFRAPRAPLARQPVRADTLDDHLAPRASREPVPDGCGDWSRGHAKLHGPHSARAISRALDRAEEIARVLVIPEPSRALRERQRGRLSAPEPVLSAQQQARIDMHAAVLAALRDEPPPEAPVRARVSGQPRSKRTWVRFAG